ncbi:MAG TPA: AMP-binding protein [Ramlibacter sp.]|nr:AMP-binding protein [Ramlibacter sp.]
MNGYGVKQPMPGVAYPSPELLAGYVGAGELRTTTLTEALMASFRKHASRVALATVSRDYTYQELDSLTSRFAAGLMREGLKPLDRVLFQAGNSPDLIIAFVGCLKAGLIPVCTLPAHREREIGYLGVHSEARAHVVQGDDSKFDLADFARQMQARIPSMHRIISIGGEAREGVLRMDDLIAREDAQAAARAVASVPRDPFQIGVFQLSGGTTGVPKIIPRTQNGYLLNAERTIQVMDFVPDDVLFMPMPMIHNAAMVCFWLPSLLAGSSFAIPADMTPEAWGELFRAKKPTFIGLIRALLPRLDAMVDQGLGSIERVRGAWAPDAAKILREKYNLPAQAMFGMSEGLCMYCRPSDPVEARDWTVGTPLSPLDEVRLVDPDTGEEVRPGEVGLFTCRGPYTLNGYYNAPERNAEAFTPDGFYKGGDMMVQREIEGKLYYAFAGRATDVISRGHEKINCEDLEAGISTHPAVSGCAVVGMPDELLGERVCAFLVLRHGHAAPAVQDMAQHLERMGFAKFKWPERIEVIEALPLTKVGKLDKAALRANLPKLPQGA